MTVNLQKTKFNEENIKNHNCNSKPYFDTKSGELVCQKCGLVIEENIQPISNTWNK